MKKPCAECVNFKQIDSIFCQHCSFDHINWKWNGLPKKETISIADVRKLSLKYYEDGGDGVYECYSDSQILDAIEAGAVTEADWVKVFSHYYNVREDIRNS